MARHFPAPILERLRAPRWLLLVLCLLVPSSLLQSAHKWQTFVHAVVPVTLEHHDVHHAAGHFHEADHSHAPNADTEHHREHHAEHDDRSHDQALLSGFRWSPPPQNFVLLLPGAVLANAIVPSAPRELKPFGRDGPDTESPPAEHLSLPLAGRSPPVA